MDQSLVTQNRRSRRSNVMLTATIEAGGNSHGVRLRNLSADGALIEGRNLPPQGTDVRFIRKEIEVEGRVIWSNGEHAGIAFGRPLETEVVLRHIPPPKPRIQADFRRPGLACKALTPSQRRMLESWFATAPVGRPGE